MKILFLVDRFPEISQSFILNQIVSLLNSNINIRVLSLKHLDVYTKHDEFENVINIVDYLDKHISDRIASLLINKIRFYPEHFRIKISPEEVSLLIYLLAKRPDIIHCHFGTLGRLVSKLKQLKFFNGKIITSFHGYDISAFLKYRGGYMRI